MWFVSRYLASMIPIYQFGQKLNTKKTGPAFFFIGWKNIFCNWHKHFTIYKLILQLLSWIVQDFPSSLIGSIEVFHFIFIDFFRQWKGNQKEPDTLHFLPILNERGLFFQKGTHWQNLVYSRYSSIIIKITIIIIRFIIAIIIIIIGFFFFLLYGQNIVFYVRKEKDQVAIIGGV